MGRIKGMIAPSLAVMGGLSASLKGGAAMAGTGASTSGVAGAFDMLGAAMTMGKSIIFNPMVLSSLSGLAAAAALPMASNILNPRAERLALPSTANGVLATQGINAITTNRDLLKAFENRHQAQKIDAAVTDRNVTKKLGYTPGEQMALERSVLELQAQSRANKEQIAIDKRNAAIHIKANRTDLDIEKENLRNGGSQALLKMLMDDDKLNEKYNAYMGAANPLEKQRVLNRTGLTQVEMDSLKDASTYISDIKSNQSVYENAGQKERAIEDSAINYERQAMILQNREVNSLYNNNKKFARDTSNSGTGLESRILNTGIDFGHNLLNNLYGMATYGLVGKEKNIRAVRDKIYERNDKNIEKTANERQLARYEEQYNNALENGALETSDEMNRMREAMVELTKNIENLGEAAANSEEDIRLLNRGGTVDPNTGRVQDVSGTGMHTALMQVWELGDALESFAQGDILAGALGTVTTLISIGNTVARTVSTNARQYGNEMTQAAQASRQRHRDAGTENALNWTGNLAREGAGRILSVGGRIGQAVTSILNTPAMAQLFSRAGRIMGGLIQRYIISPLMSVFDQIKQSVETYKIVESALVHIQAATGASHKEIYSLVGVINQAGIESSKTTAEVAELTKGLVRSGFAMYGLNDTFHALTLGVVRLSEATGEDVGVAGEAIGAFVNMFKRGANDIADVLTIAGNNVQVGLDSIILSMSHAGSLAISAGQSMETSMAMVTTLMRTGISPYTSGTMVKNIISRIQAPRGAGAAQLNTALQQLAYEDPDIKKALQKRGQSDATGYSIKNPQGGLSLTMEELIPALYAKLMEMGGNSLIQKIFGAQAEGGFRLLGGDSANLFKHLSKLYNGASGIAAYTQEKTLYGSIEGAFRYLQGSMDTLHNTIGQNLAPAVISIVKVLSTMANNVTKAGSKLGGFTSLLGDLSIIISTFVNSNQGLFTSISNGLSKTLADIANLVTNFLAKMLSENSVENFFDGVMDFAQNTYNFIKGTLSTMGTVFYNLNSFIIDSVTAIAKVLGVGKSGVIRDNYNSLSSTNKDGEILIDSVVAFNREASLNKKAYGNLSRDEYRRVLFDGDTPNFDSNQRSALNEIAINRYGGARDLDSRTKIKLDNLEKSAEIAKTKEGVDSQAYIDAKAAYVKARDAAQIELEENNVTDMFYSPKNGAASVRSLYGVLDKFVSDLSDEQFIRIVNAYQEAGKNISSRQELRTNLLQSEMSGVYDNDLSNFLFNKGGNIEGAITKIIGGRGFQKDNYAEEATQYQLTTNPISSRNPPDKEPDVTAPGLDTEAIREKGKAIEALTGKYGGIIPVLDAFSYATTGYSAINMVGDTDGARLLSNMFGREKGSNFNGEELKQMEDASVTIRDKNNQKRVLNLKDIVSSGGELDDDFSGDELKSLLMYLAELKQQNPTAYENLFETFPGLRQYKPMLDDSQTLLSPLGQDDLGVIMPDNNTEKIEEFKGNVEQVRNNVAERIDTNGTLENKAIARATFEKALRELSIDPNQLINLMENPEVQKMYQTDAEKESFLTYLQNLQQNLNTGSGIDSENVNSIYQDFLTRLPSDMTDSLAWTNDNFVNEQEKLTGSVADKTTTVLASATLAQRDLDLEYTITDTESGFEIDFDKLHRIDEKDPEGKEFRNVSTVFVWSPVTIKIIEIGKHSVTGFYPAHKVDKNGKIIEAGFKVIISDIDPLPGITIGDLKNNGEDTGIVGTRIIVADKNGEYVKPKIRFEWYDPKTNSSAISAPDMERAAKLEEKLRILSESDFKEVKAGNRDYLDPQVSTSEEDYDTNIAYGSKMIELQIARQGNSESKFNLERAQMNRDRMIRKFEINAKAIKAKMNIASGGLITSQTSYLNDLLTSVIDFNSSLSEIVDTINSFSSATRKSKLLLEKNITEENQKITQQIAEQSEIGADNQKTDGVDPETEKVQTTYVPPTEDATVAGIDGNKAFYDSPRWRQFGREMAMTAATSVAERNKIKIEAYLQDMQAINDLIQKRDDILTEINKRVLEELEKANQAIAPLSENKVDINVMGIRARSSMFGRGLETLQSNLTVAFSNINSYIQEIGRVDQAIVSLKHAISVEQDDTVRQGWEKMLSQHETLKADMLKNMETLVEENKTKFMVGIADVYSSFFQGFSDAVDKMFAGYTKLFENLTQIEIGKIERKQSNITFRYGEREAVETKSTYVRPARQSRETIRADAEKATIEAISKIRELRLKQDKLPNLISNQSAYIDKLEQEKTNPNLTPDAVKEYDQDITAAREMKAGFEAESLLISQQLNDETENYLETMQKLEREYGQLGTVMGRVLVDIRDGVDSAFGNLINDLFNIKGDKSFGDIIKDFGMSLLNTIAQTGGQMLYEVTVKPLIDKVFSSLFDALTKGADLNKGKTPEEVIANIGTQLDETAKNLTGEVSTVAERLKIMRQQMDSSFRLLEDYIDKSIASIAQSEEVMEAAMKLTADQSKEIENNFANMVNSAKEIEAALARAANSIGKVVLEEEKTNLEPDQEAILNWISGRESASSELRMTPEKLGETVARMNRGGEGGEAAKQELLKAFETVGIRLEDATIDGKVVPKEISGKYDPITRTVGDWNMPEDKPWGKKFVFNPGHQGTNTPTGTNGIRNGVVPDRFIQENGEPQSIESFLNLFSSEVYVEEFKKAGLDASLYVPPSGESLAETNTKLAEMEKEEGAQVYQPHFDWWKGRPGAIAPETPSSSDVVFAEELGYYSKDYKLPDGNDIDAVEKGITVIEVAPLDEKLTKLAQLANQHKGTPEGDAYIAQIKDLIRPQAAAIAQGIRKEMDAQEAEQKETATENPQTETAPTETPIPTEVEGLPVAQIDVQKIPVPEGSIEALDYFGGGLDIANSGKDAQGIIIKPAYFATSQGGAVYKNGNWNLTGNPLPEPPPTLDEALVEETPTATVPAPVTEPPTATVPAPVEETPTEVVPTPVTEPPTVNVPTPGEVLTDILNIKANVVNINCDTIKNQQTGIGEKGKTGIELAKTEKDRAGIELAKTEKLKKDIELIQNPITNGLSIYNKPLFAEQFRPQSVSQVNPTEGFGGNKQNSLAPMLKGVGMVSGLTGILSQFVEQDSEMAKIMGIVSQVSGVLSMLGGLFTGGGLFGGGQQQQGGGAMGAISGIAGILGAFSGLFLKEGGLVDETPRTSISPAMPILQRFQEGGIVEDLPRYQTGGFVLKTPSKAGLEMPKYKSGGMIKGDVHKYHRIKGEPVNTANMMLGSEEHGVLPFIAFNSGGLVPGFELGRGDIIPALLEPGEAVLNRMAVQHIGTEVINELNKGRAGTRSSDFVKLQTGGVIDNSMRLPKFKEGGVLSTKDIDMLGYAQGGVIGDINTEKGLTKAYYWNSNQEKGMPLASIAAAKDSQIKNPYQSEANMNVETLANSSVNSSTPGGDNVVRFESKVIGNIEYVSTNQIPHIVNSAVAKMRKNLGTVNGRNSLGIK